VVCGGRTRLLFVPITPPILSSGREERGERREKRKKRL